MDLKLFSPHALVFRLSKRGAITGPHRRSVLSLAGFVLCVNGLMLSGCNVFSKKDSDEVAAGKKLEKLLVAPQPPDLVRQAAVPHGLTFLSVEGVAAVNGLPGTGGPIAPTSLRDDLVEEMKKHDVSDPHGFLERAETALVRVQGIIPPAARRGDLLDLMVISPPKSDATDLHGGWLMDTRLRQQQKLAGAVRKSEVLAIGMGPVLVRADHESGDEAALNLQAIVLGGGRIQQERKLGLVIRPEYQHVKMAKQITESINSRFFFFDGASRTGIAKAIEDDFIEIQLHPRYRRNVHRLMAVVSMVSPKGESSKTQTVLVELGQRILEPTTSNDAALQLEALGDSAIPTLVSALTHTSSEIRFNAAQALAYLDRNEAIQPLVEASRDEAAFRYHSLIALEGMENRAALDGLVSLMDEPSIETRYGAMRSIRRRPDRDTVLRSTTMSGGYRYYQIASKAPPFIAISLTETPEIVCFGEQSKVKIEDYLLGPGGIVIQPGEASNDTLRISRFTPGAEDRRAEVPATIDGLLMGISAVGGGYGESIAILRSAKTNNHITCGLALDPLPQAMRTFHRDQSLDPNDPASLPPSDITPTKPKESKEHWWSMRRTDRENA